MAVAALLIFSLLGIPFFLGYLARYVKQVRSNNDLTLPQWNEWIALLVESWELLLLIFAYGLLPILLVWKVSSVWSDWVLYFEFFTWLPTTVVLFISIQLIALAYSEFLDTQKLEAAFNIGRLVELYKHYWSELMIPTITFWGTVFLGFPVFGFSTAIAMTIYFPIVFIELENNRYR